MPNRSSKPKPSSDPNVAAFQVVSRLTGSNLEPAKPKPAKKNPAAVALGRLGGLKGGKARADSLTEAQRKAIASKAAQARWAKPH